MSSPWVGWGLQSISLYDAPSAAWLFRSSLLGMVLLKGSFRFFNKQSYWLWLRWSFKVPLADLTLPCCLLEARKVMLTARCSGMAEQCSHSIKALSPNIPFLIQ